MAKIQPSVLSRDRLSRKIIILAAFRHAGAISDLNFNPCLKISQEHPMEQDIVPDTHAARFIVPFRNHPLRKQEM